MNTELIEPLEEDTQVAIRNAMFEEIGLVEFEFIRARILKENLEILILVELSGMPFSEIQRALDGDEALFNKVAPFMGG